MTEGRKIRIEKDPRQEIDKPPVPDPEVYQQLLDPAGTLPIVTLVEEPPSDVEYEWKNIKIRNEKDEVVGIILLSNSSWPGTTFIVDIRRFEQHEHQRYGRAAYVALVKQLAEKGMRLVSGNSLSRDALATWEWMVDKGAARLLLHREPNEAAKNYHYSTSLYEII